MLLDRLFETTEMNGLFLSNRFVRSATWEGLAAEKDGTPGKELEEYYQFMGRQGIGLIIQGHAFVRPEGQASVRQIGIHGDHQIPAHRRIVVAVHGGGGRICAQLAHGGLLARPDLSGMESVAPSPGAEGLEQTARELTPDEIEEISLSFGRAAGRAREAGYDAVQIHAAHNYLLSQFLSPHYNKRSDNYGGPIKNRVRALVEVYRAVRKEVGRDYPVLVKINASDFLEDGLTPEDSIRAATILGREGADAVELSGGSVIDPKFSPFRPGSINAENEVYYRDTARAMRSAISCPLILVGGIRNPKTCAELVENGTADYIAFCRPLIREPGMIERWRSGDLRPSGCLQDNSCFNPIIAGEGVVCPMLAQAGEGEV